ncbi:MarR family transcriptional regulator [Aminipila luticellarii]|uniref:MarR family transcriptional regulator n=2 Tax=Aminipila luticellarii TaxID=2507160 RepID=A0A410PYT7_9FIRM|nr:MarR family transcriptional regulator [Aminipila luticellarii]
MVRLLKTAKKELNDYSFEKAKQYGFTGPQLFLVLILEQDPGISLQELSEKLRLSKSTVSGIVDRLVCQGDVVREIPSEDRRSVKLFLSSDFSERYDLMEIRRSFLTDLIKDASIEDLDIAIEGLEKTYEIIEKAKIKDTKR